MTRSDLRKQVYLIAAIFGAALMTVTLASIKGWIPPRLFAWSVIAVVVVGYIAFYRLFRQAGDKLRASGEFDKPLDEPTRLRYRSNIRRLKIWVAFMIFFLVYGLWSTRNDPPTPRIVGASVNILLDIYLVWLIRKLQRRLNEPRQESADR
jgi:hypothetical protein